MRSTSPVRRPIRSSISRRPTWSSSCKAATFESGNYTLQSTGGLYGINGGAILTLNSGSLTITNVNPYTGNTTLNGGSLSFVTGGIGSGSVVFGNNATLQWEPPAIRKTCRAGWSSATV